MCIISTYVNNNLRCKAGRPPKSSQALRAFVAAVIFRDQLLGVDTAVAAAACTGTTWPSLNAASLLLQTGDTDLVRDVLRGHAPLIPTAAKIRNRIRLLESFRAATPEDLAALTDAVGAEKLFDAAIAPALL